MTDRSPHDEADDRLTRACAADGHPPADPDDPTERCACGEKWSLPHLTEPEGRRRCLIHEAIPPAYVGIYGGPRCTCPREDTP